jgi:hypothetical protein
VRVNRNQCSADINFGLDGEVEGVEGGAKSYSVTYIHAYRTGLLLPMSSCQDVFSKQLGHGGSKWHDCELCGRVCILLSAEHLLPRRICCHSYTQSMCLLILLCFAVWGRINSGQGRAVPLGEEIFIEKRSSPSPDHMHAVLDDFFLHLSSFWLLTGLLLCLQLQS